MYLAQVSCKKRPTVSSGRDRGGYRAKGLSSLSKLCGNMKFPVCPPSGIQQVTINSQLLQPLDLAIDPTIQKVKAEEREQIKTLNNKFATLLDKVRFMEQQNKVLETKWKLLQEQGTKGSTKSASQDFQIEKYIADLKRYLDNLINGKSRFQNELKTMQDSVEQYKKKYEDEINKRTKAENDSVVLKKDVDTVCTLNTELEAEVDALTSEIEFLTNLYAVELSQLQDQIANTAVVLAMDNNRDFNQFIIIRDAKFRYEQIVQRSKLEAEALYDNKYKELHKTIEGYGKILKNSKTQITELNRTIRRLKAEIENVKKQITALNQSIAATEERGNLALKDAEKKLKDLEDAEKKLKEYMSRQLKEYQELLSEKLTLDFEIGTYRTMLDGEEGRMSGEIGNNYSLSVPIGDLAVYSALGGAAGEIGGDMGGEMEIGDGMEDGMGIGGSMGDGMGSGHGTGYGHGGAGLYEAGGMGYERDTLHRRGSLKRFGRKIPVAFGGGIVGMGNLGGIGYGHGAYDH